MGTRWKSYARVLLGVLWKTVAGGVCGALGAWWCIEAASGCDGGLCVVCVFLVPPAALVGFLISLPAATARLRVLSATRSDEVHP